MLRTRSSSLVPIHRRCASSFTLPLSQILREDFASLGVKPVVAPVLDVHLRLAGDHRAWDVIWVSVPGDIIRGIEFVCSGLDIPASYTGEGTCTTKLVAEAAGGTALSGMFELAVVFQRKSDEGEESETTWAASETTALLAYNSTAADVRRALEGLDGIAKAEVQLIHSLSTNLGSGGTYVVTFPGALTLNSPMGGLSLTASASGLNGTMATAVVREIYSGSQWGGEFALAIGGLEGLPLRFDAGVDKVRYAVDDLLLSAGGKKREVDVWREEVEAGFRWMIAFSRGDVDGDISLIKVKCHTRVQQCAILFCSSGLLTRGNVVSLCKS